jgi:hypothetical protein
VSCDDDTISRASTPPMLWPMSVMLFDATARPVGSKCASVCASAWRMAWLFSGSGALVG